MENEKCRFSYSDLDDSLIISCKKENENVKERYGFGNFTFNLTGQGKIVGLQIQNASQMFEEYNIDPKFLDNIETVEMDIQKEKELLGIAILFKSQNEERKMPIQMLNFQTN